MTDEVVLVMLWQCNDLFVKDTGSGVTVWRGGLEWAATSPLELSWEECAWIMGRLRAAGSRTASRASMTEGNPTVEEARRKVEYHFLQFPPTEANAALDVLIEAVRQEERERVEYALSVLSNYQLWPETRLSQARRILERAIERGEV